MNMAAKRGPKKKEFLLCYSWDQIPVLVDQGLICNLLGITKPTLRKYEQEGLITRIPGLPPRVVRYKKEDVMRLAGESPEEGEGAA